MVKKKANEMQQLIKPNSLNMFRAVILPIFRSIRLCNTAYGMFMVSPTGNVLGTTYHKLYYTV